jgi:cyclophilin family peptidyl-prolyl cis-trans isomerase
VLQTTVNQGDGKIVIEVLKDYSPNGVQRLYELLSLMNGSYYDDTAFYWVQQGI